MKLIVGLGNPGIEYQFTPHNLGFLAIDRIAGNLGVEVRNRQCRAQTARTVIADQMVLLAKPETFMNLSGLAVRELLREYEASPESDLIVIQDELDFPLGTLRIHTRRSSAGHNGIESIIGALNTQDFLFGSGSGWRRIEKSETGQIICSLRCVSRIWQRLMECWIPQRTR